MRRWPRWIPLLLCLAAVVPIDAGADPRSRSFELHGSVRASVEENYGEIQDRPLDDARLVAAGEHEGYSDEAGDFVIEVPEDDAYEVLSRLSGRFCEVERYDAADATITNIGAPGDPIEFFYDDANSHLAERNAYYHVNVIHDWITETDPDFTALDYPVSVLVNAPYSCGAMWQDGSLSLGRAGFGCNNAARVSDAVYHAYGHGITRAYYSPGQPPVASGMDEAFSDIDALCIQPNRFIGEGFFEDGSALRDGENLRQYPGDECNGDVFCLSEILTGAMWKTRKNLALKYGEETASVFDPLYIAALRSRPYTMPEFLTQLLSANDDDGDLTNGTPDWDEICDAFALHNLPCPPLERFVEVISDPIDDQTDASGGTEILATARAVGGGAIDPEQVRILYALDPIDEDPHWNDIPMQPTGNPDEYAGEIPPVSCGRIVRYYVRAATFTGESATAPPLAPYRGVHRFMTGPYEVVFRDDLEADRGWTVGGPGDTAIEGIWERVDPVGKAHETEGIAQPEDDHTLEGTRCFVTDGRGGHWTAHDVDGGATSFHSPRLDWSPPGQEHRCVVSLRFWSFLFDFAPADDSLRCDLSNDDGASWRELGREHGLGLNDWRLRRLYLACGEDGFDLTDRMRIRFRMEDGGEPTTCAEAAIDDVEIRIVCCPQTGTAEEEIPLRYALEQNRPNPFRPATAIRYSLPQAGPVRLEIFDVGGRLVRTLVDDPHREAGRHRVGWDGRDDAGRSARAGIYFYRLHAGPFERTCRMVRLH
ncbi:MAG: hypothetical protein GF346_12780 [Candidatus Eisenbacteria bacterium]|nr:hypothetical protein [Candidatus Latescibacterota bacterium]MBD3303312.1 hypothetical protein [Candidatus Eisenbacteria bacterium]